MKNVKKSSFILFSIIILILILALTFVVGNVWGISFVQEADQSSNNLNVASSSAKYETIGSTTNESTNNVIHTFKSLFSESYFSYVLDNENKAKIIGFQNSNNDDYIYIPNKIPGTYYDVVSIQSGALDKCINDLRLASLPFKGIYVEEGIEVCGEQLFNNPLIIETNPRIDFQDSKKPSGFNTFNYHINRLVAIVSNIIYSVDNNRYNVGDNEILGYSGEVNEVSLAGSIFINGEPYLINKVGVSAFENSRITCFISNPINYIDTISEKAFKNCTNLLSVSVRGAKFIEDEAFYGCEKLRSVGEEFFINVQEIGERAFYKCDLSICSININGIMKIEKEAFAFSNLLSINLDTLWDNFHIYDRTFYGCKNLKDINIKSSKYPILRLSIGNEAFMGAEALNKVTFDSTDYIQSIGEYAFKDCKSLKAVGSNENNYCDLSKLTNLGIGAFTGAESLSYVKFDTSKNSSNTINVIPKEAFMGCYNLEIVELPTQCEIESRAFYFAGYDQNRNKGLSIINMESSRKIGDEAFYGSGIKILALDEVNSLGSEAFAFSKLSKVTINCIGYLEIGENNPFFNCPNLEVENFKIARNNGKLVLEGNVLIFEDKIGSIRVIAILPSDNAIEIPSKATKISGKVFTDLSYKGQIYIKDMLTYVSADVFYGNENFGQIIVERTNDYIATSAKEVLNRYNTIFTNGTISTVSYTNKYTTWPDTFLLGSPYDIIKLVLGYEEYVATYKYCLSYDANGELEGAVILSLESSTDYFDIKIPDKINGYKVIKIADSALDLQGHKIEYLGLPNHLREGGISPIVFKNCTKLKYIYDRALNYCGTSFIECIYSCSSRSPYICIGGSIYRKVSGWKLKQFQYDLQLVCVPQQICYGMWFDGSMIKSGYPKSYVEDLRISNSVVDDNIQNKGTEYTVSTDCGIVVGAMHNLQFVKSITLPNNFPYYDTPELKEYYFEGCRYIDSLQVFVDSNYDLRIETGWIQSIVDIMLFHFQTSKGTRTFCKELMDYFSYMELSARDCSVGVGSSRFIDYVENLLLYLKHFLNQIVDLPNILSKIFFFFNIPIVRSLYAKGVSLLSEWLLKIEEICNLDTALNKFLEYAGWRFYEVFFRSLSIGGLVALLCDIIADGVVDGYADFSFKAEFGYKLQNRSRTLFGESGGTIKQTLVLMFIGDGYYNPKAREWITSL